MSEEVQKWSCEGESETLITVDVICDGHMAVLRKSTKVCNRLVSSLREKQTDEVEQLKRNRRRSSDKADRTAAHGSDVKSLVGQSS
jgi:bifunctional ADP-heptose synthase (sugar kinase/adenylyltransferase)